MDELNIMAIKAIKLTVTYRGLGLAQRKVRLSFHPRVTNGLPTVSDLTFQMTSQM